MFSFGLAFLFRNMLYLVFSIFMGYLGYKMYKLKKVGVIVFLIVWMLPYYDLFIQKGIKTYYEIFKMNNTIYAYPEKDADGKIESLGIGESVAHIYSGYLSGMEDFTQLKKIYAVDSFLECYMSDSFLKDANGTIHYNYKSDLGYVRVDLTKEKVHYKQLKNESEYQARYQIFGIKSQNAFYEKKKIYFKDLRKNILLAEGFKIIFTIDKNSFRNKYLLWRGPSGVAFGILLRLKIMENSIDY